ncbi:MAG: class probable F420-dependent enzyme [Mycobacterium sp.]|jgi:hypothetical protein|nr:class probable F420-dependent enzyme [Mycobacterium sp.]
MVELSDDVVAFLSEGTRTGIGYLASDGRPLVAPQVQGTAQISEDPQRVVDTATRIGARYMGPDRAEEFDRRNGIPGELVVRIQPTKVVSPFDLAG